MMISLNNNSDTNNEYQDVEDEVEIILNKVSTLKVYDGDDDDEEEGDEDDEEEDCEDGHNGQKINQQQKEIYHPYYVITQRMKTSNKLASFSHLGIKTNKINDKNQFIFVNNIKEDDKDSLVGTSASDDEDSIIDTMESVQQNMSPSTSTALKSLHRCCTKSSSTLLSTNRKMKKCWNEEQQQKTQRKNEIDTQRLRLCKSEWTSLTSKSPNCYCSDMIESDHYTTDSSNSSNDNLTFSPLPSMDDSALRMDSFGSVGRPISPGAGVKDIDDRTIGKPITAPTIALRNSSRMIESIGAPLNHINLPSTIDNQNDDEMISLQSPSIISRQNCRSSTLASIRDAVSHLTRLDDFNVVKLSQGFFSQVFKVTHLPTGKIMVLKMNKNPGNRGNALKEIELLNKLNHPNIVAYMGTVVHEGGLHPLLEYINGGTLEQLIHKYYPHHKNPDNSIYNDIYIDVKVKKCWVSSPKVHRLRNPDRTFMKLMQDVCRGMAYLHSKGYLHRDLASKNIFIRKRLNDSDQLNCKKNYNQDFQTLLSDANKTLPNDHIDQDNIIICDDHRLEAVIGDFGFATCEPSPEQKLSIVGSPYWLGPECLKNKWYNHKCDIFSFGVICCELNWRTPSDPDFLPRCDNYAIDFVKLSNKKDTLLGRVAMMACQYEPEKRPEFHELLKIFNRELNSEIGSKLFIESNFDNCDYSPMILPKASFNSSKSSLSFQNQQSEDDVFEQHLQRRRHSSLINCHNLDLMVNMNHNQKGR